MEYLTYGAIIGKVNLVSIYKTEWLLLHLEADPFHNWKQELAFDDYSPSWYAWELAEAKELGCVLPLKGSLGLWEYKGDV